MEMETKKRRLFIAVSILIVFSLAFITIGRPMMIGYSTYRAVRESNYTLDDYHQIVSQKVDEANVLEKERDDAVQQLTSYRKEVEGMNSQLKGVSEQIKSLEQEKAAELNELMKELSYKNSEIQKEVDEKEEVLDDYDRLIKNTVKSICCKMKIDNSDISGYEIIKDKITCVEDGGKKLDCSFDD